MAQYKKAKPQAQAQTPVYGNTPGAAAIGRPVLAAQPVALLRSMDQERAEFALTKIQNTAIGPEAVQVEVRRYLNGLPALIRMNGLGQALAFYRMKGNGSSHELIYRMVGDWLCSANSKGRVFTQDADVLTAITRSDIHHYMAAQNEALALLEWLKKFALALLRNED